MTFTSSALQSEKQDSEFGIQGRGNWKSETGNWELVASAYFHFLVSIFFPVQFSISNF
jgi:hypothetical protein